MLFTNSIEDKYIEISNYIFDNFDTVVTNNEYMQKYIEQSKHLIERYQNIWPILEYKRIISNIITLNLFIINNFE
jgi:hypothetical protein